MSIESGFSFTLDFGLFVFIHSVSIFMNYNIPSTMMDLGIIIFKTLLAEKAIELYNTKNES